MRLKPQKRMGEPVIYRGNWKFCLIVKTQAHERMLLRYLRPSCASPFAYSDAETRGAPDCRSPVMKIILSAFAFNRNCFRQLSLLVSSAFHENSSYSDEHCSYRVFSNSSCDYEDRKKSHPARLCEREGRERCGHFREQYRRAVLRGDDVCSCDRDHYLRHH